MKSNNDTILLISDLHCPYNHPDAFAFLKDVRDAYKPTRVICMGDEIDNHAISFHDSNPDLPAAGDELAEAINELKILYKLFPKVDVLHSNHGSLSFRKALHHGLPKAFIKNMKEVLEAPKGWEWHMDMLLDLPGGNQCYFHHGLIKDPAKAVALRGMCVVQGHYHEDAKITYVSNPNNLLWGMSTGCLIDKDSMAFEYNSVNLKRPILSVCLIVDGLPVIIPMVLNKKGRWRGFV